MTKADLVKAVAEVGLTKKKAAEAVEAMLDVIKDALVRGEKVQLIGFGSFNVKERPSRRGRNPQTGAELTIPAKRVPVFRPGTALKEAVR
jgi:DNA-binding protein HU-beta